VDFIQKHIFPGSLLLSFNRVSQLMSKHGGFVVRGVDDMGRDYSKTLRLWRDRFEINESKVRQLGFDEWFLRKWRYYLGYCEAAFEMRNISVVQAVFSRANNLSA
jgi:cyclopropane-fatty-acyl-phospholipid synthase